MFEYLLSFHYYRTTDLDKLAEAAGAPELTFFADSGAFSARYAGAEIKLTDYAAWLRRWRHRIHVYANLDVVHDVETSRRNLEALREHGFDPLPVWHAGSPVAELERILAEPETDYLAIGGLVHSPIKKRDPRMWAFLEDLHERAAGAGVRLHGFGLSAWPILRAFPWYSADSSTSSTGFRYGNVTAYDPYADTWHQWHLRDRRAWGRHGWIVREYDLTPADFAGSNVEARAALITLAARSWSLAAARLAGRTYTTPHLSVSTIGADGGTEIARSIMRAYEDGNRYATRLYVADPHPTPRCNVERFAAWWEHNLWTAPDAKGALGRA